MNQKLTHPTQDAFRPSINGLRGIAVLMVILFHWSHLRGGFTGVDVFFVISGFLISGHIFRDLSEDRFSFASFYAKRTRRIFPNLIVILLFCLGLGWLWSFAEPFQLLGKHIQSGALFLSNFRLYGESGYFDSAAETKPLLHLWSLAIEEQFYLIWPVLLWASYRLFKRIEGTVLVAFALSFAINLYLSKNNAEMDFYLLPSRLWELALGCLVFTSRPRLQRFYDSSVSQIVGFVLIIAGCFAIRGQAGFPGYHALIPVLGAGLLLGASENGVINRSILSTRALGFFGTISYPLYLWHWPLYSFMKSLMLNEIMLGLAISTLVLSYLTHRFVEKPILRLPITERNRGLFIGVGAGLLLLISAAGTLVGNGTIRGRMLTRSLPPSVDLPHKQGKTCEANGDQGTQIQLENFKPCDEFKFPGAPIVLLVGDSHAGALNAGLIDFAERNHFNLVTFVAVFCTPLSQKDHRPACRDFNRYVDQWIARVKPDLVVFDAYHRFWSDNDGYAEPVPYQDFVISKLSEIKKTTGKQVLLIGQNPCWHISLTRVLNIAFLARGIPVPERTFQGISEDTLEWDQIMKDAAARSGIPYFSIKDELCNKEGCRVRVGDHLATDLMEFDYGHLTYPGSIYVVGNGLGAKILKAISPR